MAGGRIALADAEVDRRLMGAAIRLGERGGQGLSHGAGALVVGGEPNEPVILARGFGATGRAAATVALGAAGDAARFGTLYVTIEPSPPPEGEGGPDPILASGISRLVSALDDPAPGRTRATLARLREAGVDVTAGILGAEARRLHRGELSLAAEERPHVTLKLAVSADGMIGRKSGERMLVSGPEAFARLQALRLASDATLIGIETALVNDPRLTVRHAGLAGRSPARILLDRTARIPVTAALMTSIDEAPLLVAVGPDAEPGRVAALAAGGARVFTVQKGPGGLDIRAVLHHLGSAGIRRLLVEGGARVASTLVGQALADEVVLFRAPVVVGSEGVRALAGGALSAIERNPRYRLTATARLGEDRMLRYERTT